MSISPKISPYPLRFRSPNVPSFSGNHKLQSGSSGKQSTGHRRSLTDSHTSRLPPPSSGKYSRGPAVAAPPLSRQSSTCSLKDSPVCPCNLCASQSPPETASKSLGSGRLRSSETSSSGATMSPEATIAMSPALASLAAMSPEALVALAAMPPEARAAMSPALAALGAMPHDTLSPAIPPGSLKSPTSPEVFGVGQFCSDMAYMHQNVAYFEHMFEALTQNSPKAVSPLAEEQDAMVQQLQQEVARMAPVRDALQQHLEVMPGELQQRVSRIRALVETLDENNLIRQEDDNTLGVMKRSGSMVLSAGCHLSMRMRELRNGEWDNLKWYCWLLASVVAFGGFIWGFVLPVLGGVPLA